MNSSARFSTICGLVGLALWGCTSVDRSGAQASAGASNEAGAGATPGLAGSGGSGDSLGSMAGDGDSASAGQRQVAGASGATPGGGGAGTGGAVSGGGSGTDDGGAAGAVPDPGEAGMGGQGPVVLLKNPSFELGGLAGWQVLVSPDNVGKAIYTQWGSPTGESIDGMYEVSFWNGTAAFTGDLHQTVSGLTPGKYEFKAYIAFGSLLNSAYLYAIGCGPTDIRVDLPIADTVPTFAPFSISNIDVTGDSCTVGLFVDLNTGNWLNADAFVFGALPVP